MPVVVGPGDRDVAKHRAMGQGASAVPPPSLSFMVDVNVAAVSGPDLGDVGRQGFTGHGEQFRFHLVDWPAIPTRS